MNKTGSQALTLCSYKILTRCEFYRSSGRNHHMNKLTLTILAGVVLIAGAATAAENPIATRKAMMQNVLAATQMGGGMLKGKIEYNPVAAQMVLRVLNQAALGIGEHFPKGSESGMKTTAGPKIWSDMGGFNTALAKFAADTSAGFLKPEEIEFFDKDAFGAAFGKAASNCKFCHQDYRVKKN